ncbi:membrane protein [Ramlibacter tataouinensis]|uniref:Candidate membrane protein n=1 Tax=Ramlibacter tataouinensis (strain ATCC BAA-407 / DSM 14655 / LMG 21543 / TTB310) TaxID=365046 RepID=F5Y2T0_RAMTT|nr:membrane protein [Ramlibacter tataouinensis]AEG93626.1 candidate membrane protein [Ramlibacter tataouinensis TTB310]
MTNWNWIAKYIAVVVAALLLGVILSSFPLFKTATLGTPKLTAALLVQFIAHVAALVMLSILGWRVAEQMRHSDDRLNAVAAIVMALVTLVVTAVGYVVLSGFMWPFVGKEIKGVVNWIFILGVVAAATWLIYAIFAGADEMVAALRHDSSDRSPA